MQESWVKGNINILKRLEFIYINAECMYLSSRRTMQVARLTGSTLGDLVNERRPVVWLVDNIRKSVMRRNQSVASATSLDYLARPASQSHFTVMSNERPRCYPKCSLCRIVFYLRILTYHRTHLWLRFCFSIEHTTTVWMLLASDLRETHSSGHGS